MLCTAGGQVKWGGTRGRGGGPPGGQETPRRTRRPTPRCTWPQGARAGPAQIHTATQTRASAGHGASPPRRGGVQPSKGRECQPVPQRGRTWSPSHDTNKADVEGQILCGPTHANTGNMNSPILQTERRTEAPRAVEGAARARLTGTRVSPGDEKAQKAAQHRECAERH